ncbi:MAG: protoporphyrinogen oxidase HemJ [Paracoccaceae bacterium]
MVWDLLAAAYPWTKSLHVISVIAWMAGLFYLPRLFVYHAERVTGPGELADTLQTMQHKLLKVIVNPAGVATWVFGLLLVLTPGVIDWSALWVWGKAALVVGMTTYHHALVRWERAFATGANTRPGRFYRAINEVPTLLMIGIVVFVIVKPY